MDMLTVREVFELLKSAGICKNVAFVYTKTRAGELKATMQRKSTGYLYNANDVLKFIEKKKPPNVPNPLVRLQELENKVFQLEKIPQSIKEAGMLKEIERLRIENQMLKNENMQLKAK